MFIIRSIIFIIQIIAKNICAYEDCVHLTLPPHSFFVQVKSGACYITSQWVASSG